LAYADRDDDDEAVARREFTAGLPAGGRVLLAGLAAGGGPEPWRALGLRVDGFDRDEGAVVRSSAGDARGRYWRTELALLTLEREAYDGIWAWRSLLELPPVGVQRVLQQFFAALRRGGSFGLALETTAAGGAEVETVEAEGRRVHRYPPHELHSLLRQSGLTLIREGVDRARPERRFLLARRLI
jgi:hypothetical protein